MYTPVTGGTVGGEVVAIPGGAGVSTSTLVPPLSSPASSGAIVGLLVVGATVGAGPVSYTHLTLPTILLV